MRVIGWPTPGAPRGDTGRKRARHMGRVSAISARFWAGIVSAHFGPCIYTSVMYKSHTSWGRGRGGRVHCHSDGDARTDARRETCVLRPGHTSTCDHDARLQPARAARRAAGENYRATRAPARRSEPRPVVAPRRLSPLCHTAVSRDIRDTGYSYKVGVPHVSREPRLKLRLYKFYLRQRRACAHDSARIG